MCDVISKSRLTNLAKLCENDIGLLVGHLIGGRGGGGGGGLGTVQHGLHHLKLFTQVVLSLKNISTNRFFHFIELFIRYIVRFSNILLQDQISLLKKFDN